MEKTRAIRGWTVPMCLAALALYACNDSNPMTLTSTGGTTSTGGSQQTGGDQATGGSQNTGGDQATGGSRQTGGDQATGGTGTGGKDATGGARTGGREVLATGGRTMGTGGSPRGTGGAPDAGVGGQVTSDGGSSSTGAPVPSSGCSATTTATPCNTQAAPCTLDIKGTQRKFWMQLPDGYNPTQPYPVVFEYHPMGGNGWQGLTMYQIRQNFPKAIYVSPEGTGSGTLGFPNTGGMDEALTRAMMEDLEAKYCVDKSRYFATGFSYGGSMSFTAACNMSDVFRAIGSAAGSTVSGAKCTSKVPERPVAVWATHGDADTVLPISGGKGMIDVIVKNNGCTTTTKPVDPSPCVEYQGCKTGYPVVWCVRPGDPHAIPSFFKTAVAKFFQQF